MQLPEVGEPDSLKEASQLTGLKMDMFRRLMVWLGDSEVALGSLPAARRFREQIAERTKMTWQQLEKLQEKLVSSAACPSDAEEWKHNLKVCQGLVETVQANEKWLLEELRGISPQSVWKKGLVREFKALSACAERMFLEYERGPCPVRLCYFSEVQPGDVLVQRGIRTIVLGDFRSLRHPFDAPVLSSFADGRLRLHPENLSSLLIDGSLQYIERCRRPLLGYAVATHIEQGPVVWNSLGPGDLVEFSRKDNTALAGIEVLDIKRSDGQTVMALLLHDEENGLVKVLKARIKADTEAVIWPDAEANLQVLQVVRRRLEAFQSEVPARQTRSRLLVLNNYAPEADASGRIDLPDRNSCGAKCAAGMKEPDLLSCLNHRLDVLLGWQGAPEFHSAAFQKARRDIKAFARSLLEQSWESAGSRMGEIIDPVFVQELAGQTLPAGISRQVARLFNSIVQR